MIHTVPEFRREPGEFRTDAPSYTSAAASVARPRDSALGAHLDRSALRALCSIVWSSLRSRRGRVKQEGDRRGIGVSGRRFPGTFVLAESALVCTVASGCHLQLVSHCESKRRNALFHESAG